MNPVPTFKWTDYKAVLFDLDGVITPTADIHQRAWLALFEPWNATGDDYLRYIDGRPRYDGVKTFLASRHVVLPWGDPPDPPGNDTICALGNRKNDLFNEILETDGIAPYPGSLAVLDLLDSAEIAQAVVSSSRNAIKVLAAAGLGSRFATIIDGQRAAAEGLPGKPDPAMFVRGAELLGVSPTDAIVVEDATAGAAAGAAGGFGFVLGVDRGGNRDALAAAGANLVVNDLSDTVNPSDNSNGNPT